MTSYFLMGLKGWIDPRFIGNHLLCELNSCFFPPTCINIWALYSPIPISLTHQRCRCTCLYQLHDQNQASKTLPPLYCFHVVIYSSQNGYDKERPPEMPYAAAQPRRFCTANLVGSFILMCLSLDIHGSCGFSPLARSFWSVRVKNEI